MPKLTSPTLADEFAELDVLLYDFDPGATEDQDGDVHRITFSDGSQRWTTFAQEMARSRFKSGEG